IKGISDFESRRGEKFDIDQLSIKDIFEEIARFFCSDGYHELNKRYLAQKITKDLFEYLETKLKSNIKLMEDKGLTEDDLYLLDRYTTDRAKFIIELSKNKHLKRNWETLNEKLDLSEDLTKLIQLARFYRIRDNAMIKLFVGISYGMRSTQIRQDKQRKGRPARLIDTGSYWVDYVVPNPDSPDFEMTSDMATLGYLIQYGDKTTKKIYAKAKELIKEWHKLKDKDQTPENQEKINAIERKLEEIHSLALMLEDRAKSQDRRTNVKMDEIEWTKTSHALKIYRTMMRTAKNIDYEEEDLSPELQGITQMDLLEGIVKDIVGYEIKDGELEAPKKVEKDKINERFEKIFRMNLLKNNEELFTKSAEEIVEEIM
ncbi:hypothetical protein BVX93_00655, partial [bacterium B13(2017)]